MKTGEQFAFGNDTLGAPLLAPCPCCGGVADYVRQKTELGRGYRAACSVCGLTTGLYAWAATAGEKWNRRITSGARVVTLGEMLEFRAAWSDDRGVTSCWIEHIDGRLRAAQIRVSVSMDGLEVYDQMEGDYWDAGRVAAEGIRWRLWDKKPTKEDAAAAPWGVMWRVGSSEEAAKAAEALRKKIEDRRQEQAQKQAEQMRRRCLYCKNLVPVDTEGKDLGAATPFVCALDGSLAEHPSSKSCPQWTGEREAGA